MSGGGGWFGNGGGYGGGGYGGYGGLGGGGWGGGYYGPAAYGGGYYGNWYNGCWNRNNWGGFWGGVGVGAVTSWGLSALYNPLYAYSYGMSSYFPTWGAYGYSTWGLASVASPWLYSGYCQSVYHSSDPDDHRPAARGWFRLVPWHRLLPPPPWHLTTANRSA